MDNGAPRGGLTRRGEEKSGMHPARPYFRATVAIQSMMECVVGVPGS
jgi:hypothetical protein